MYQAYASQYNNNDESGGGGGGQGRPRESPRPTGSAGGPPVAGRRYNQQQQQPMMGGSIHSNADLGGGDDGGGSGGGYGGGGGYSGGYSQPTQQPSSNYNRGGGGGGGAPYHSNINNNNRIVTPTQHNRYGPQLRMSIVQCTSEDDAFPVSELSCRTSYTSGWHSAKNPEYPQEIGFRFEGEVDLQSVRILCHESKIPTRVEVYVAEASDEDRRGAQFPTYEAAIFRRLGHFNLNSNVENNFAARELKTVNVRRQCMYLKLIIRKNHINNINVFHQVSIVALAAHGTLMSTYKLPHGVSTRNEILIAGDDEVPIEQIYISKKRPAGHHGAGSATQHRGGGAGGLAQQLSNTTGDDHGSGPDYNANSDSNINQDGFDCTFGGTMDSTTGARVRELSQHKARAVEEEDYDLARALKDQIELLKDYGSQIALLEARKDVAVDAEDYATAKDLKKQIDALRAKGSNRQHGNKVIGAAPVPRNNNNNSNAYDPPAAQQQQHHQYNSNNNHNVNQGGGGGAASPAWLDERPVGGAAKPTSFDEQPVGGGGGAKKPFIPFDERPVGGGGGGGGMGGGDGGMSSSQPGSQAPTPRQPPPKRTAPAKNRGPSPPPVTGPDGEQYEQVTAKFVSSGNDEVAIGGGGGGRGAAGDDGGGIVSTNTAPRGPVVRASGEGLAEWEASFNQIVEGFAQGAQSAPEALPSAKLAEYKDYISIFGQYGTCCLFSKQWQLREGVVRAIVSDKGYPLLVDHKGSDHDVLTAFLQYCGAKGMGVHDNLANVFFAVGDALKSIVARELTPRPPAASQIASSLTPLLTEIMSKAGDNNARVRDQAASVLMTFATSSLGADKISAVALAEPATVGKKPISFRVQLARLTLISSLLEEVGLQDGKSAPARSGISSGGSGLTVDGIMNKVCLPSLLHSHQDVREAAQHLIAVLHHKSKQPIEKYLTNVKPQQRQLIEEQIANYVAAAPAAKPTTTSKAAAAPKVDNSSPTPASRKPKEPEMVSSSLSVGKNGHKELTEASARLASAEGASTTKKSKQQQIQDAKKTCQFCRYYDDRFTDDIMDMHYVQSCPMLCPCPLCGQVTEISQLQIHLTTECDRKTLVKQCPRCLEAVRAEDLAAHEAAKECIHVEPKKFNLCPLCHAKLAPGQEGWEQHLAAAPGCANNPRRFDGGNGDEFEL